MNRHYKIKLLAFVAALLIFSGCTKNLELNYFSIEIPYGWSYTPTSGVESFKGTITTPSGPITFDYNEHGLAGNVLLTEEQYLADEKNWGNQTCYFCKPGHTTAVKYTKSIRRSANEWLKYYPGANYIADLKYNDSTIYVPIYIPKNIKDHHISIDSSGAFIVKTIWPVAPHPGITGIYFKSRSKRLNFNMQGSGLSAEDEEKALKAFKTIQFKE